jgi:hypothetical protein
MGFSTPKTFQRYSSAIPALFQCNLAATFFYFPKKINSRPGGERAKKISAAAGRVLGALCPRQTAV